jgi:ATP-binding cassette subfamily C exporter for protease/lipase
MSGFRREFVLVGMLSAVANLLMLTPTLYMLQVYDRVMVSRNELTLLSVSLICLALFGVMALSEWGRSRMLVKAGVRLDEQLSTRVFNATFESRLGETQTQGQRPGRAFADLLQVRQFITGQGIFAFFDLPWVPLYIAVMFVLHPALGWLAVAFAVVQAGLAWFGHRRTVSPAEDAQMALGEVNGYLQGKLQNAETLEAMGMVDNLKPQWARRHARHMGLSAAAQGVIHKVTAVSKFVRYTQQSASLAAGALLVIHGELSPGAMIAANVLMTRALTPIDQLVGFWRSAITSWEAFKRLSVLLDDHPERPPGLRRVAPLGELTLRAVTAKAPLRAEPILKEVNFHLPAATVLVILGPSGSGKSTLARVMLGIWGDVQGEVLLDGRPIGDWERSELGPFLGYLPQDIELFDGTIAENIARFSALDSDSVIAAARAAGLHEMILRFPKGYETPVGEAGSMLSGGQRQRIALARAVYGNPRLVVLDEPNANLDDAGEQALARTVAQLKQQGATVVLVTHRPGAVALADQLLVLREGRVHMLGPRDEVLNGLRGRA